MARTFGSGNPIPERFASSTSASRTAEVVALKSERRESVQKLHREGCRPAQVPGRARPRAAPEARLPFVVLPL